MDGLLALVDFDGFLLVSRAVSSCQSELSGFSVGFDGAGMVAAEEKLTAGGAENNPDICLCSATVAPVEVVSVRSATAVVISASLVDPYTYITSIRLRSMPRMGNFAVRVSRLDQRPGRAAGQVTAVTELKDGTGMTTGRLP